MEFVAHTSPRAAPIKQPPGLPHFLLISPET
jgi:hypothetical protein